MSLRSRLERLERHAPHCMPDESCSLERRGFLWACILNTIQTLDAATQNGDDGSWRRPALGPQVSDEIPLKQWRDCLVLMLRKVWPDIPLAVPERGPTEGPDPVQDGSAGAGDSSGPADRGSGGPGGGAGAWLADGPCGYE
jgi:hypothetical protein